MRDLKQYKKIILPLFVFLLVFGGSIVGMTFLVKRILLTKKTYEKTLSERMVLQERANTLQEANVKFDDTTTRNLALALPPKDTALYIAAQIRNQANLKEVETEGILIDASMSIDEKKSAASQVNVNFSLRGSYENVASFLDSLILSLPVINFDSLDLSQNNNEVEGNIRLIAYSAPYPENLPAITNPLTGVTPSEQQIVDNINNFQKPNISQANDVVPLENPERQNPFSSQSIEPSPTPEAGE